MRNEAEIKRLIINIAVNDDRVRGVLLNGSRADPNVAPNRYQDFDIVFVVTNLAGFTDNRDWIKVFGECIISQMPDNMFFGKQHADRFAYLMILADGNRIDLTLRPVHTLKNKPLQDSLTICLLDKDNLFASLPPPSNSDYLIQRPAPEAFHDVCNEFWWVSTYVAKGLLRNEVTYAKEMLESAVRPMFMKMTEWKIGVANQFTVSFGKGGRFMHKYVEAGYYQKVLQTYADADVENNWKALFNMLELFAASSDEVAAALCFTVNKTERERTLRYLKQLYTEYKQ